MAVTGCILFLFIIGHLLGNLLVFAGHSRYNSYAAILHFDDTLLWIVRIVLIVAGSREEPRTTPGLGKVPRVSFGQELPG